MTRKKYKDLRATQQTVFITNQVVNFEPYQAKQEKRVAGNIVIERTNNIFSNPQFDATFGRFHMHNATPH